MLSAACARENRERLHPILDFVRSSRGKSESARPNDTNTEFVMIDVLPVRRANGHSQPAPSSNENGNVKDVNLPAIEEAVRTILRAVGEDPNRLACSTRLGV